MLMQPEGDVRHRQLLSNQAGHIKEPTAARLYHSRHYIDSVICDGGVDILGPVTGTFLIMW